MLREAHSVDKALGVNAEAVQQLAVQTLNVSLMLSVGLELDPAVLARSLRRRRLLAGMAALNFGAAPLLTLGLAWALGLDPAVMAGMMLAAAAPGGGTGTLLTRLARGSLELSVVLLVVLTVLAVGLTPALMTAAVGDRVPGARLELAGLLETLVLFQLSPLLLGLLIRRWDGARAITLDRLARPVSNLAFAGLFFGLLITKGHLLPRVGLPGLAAIAAATAATTALPLALPAAPADRAALSLTTGVRNIALSLLLSSTFFPDPLTTITVLTYALIMYLAAAPVVWWFRR